MKENYFVILVILLIILIYFYKSSKRNILTCNKYYIENKSKFETLNASIFSDDDLRKYFFPTFKKVYPSIPDDNCILDIGSNIGEISEMFHNFYNTSNLILAEPLMLNYERTKRKFESVSQILTVHTAIGYNANKKTFKHYRAGDMMTINRNLVSETISFMNLDDFYYSYSQNKNVFFLKIDVEGYEDEVLFTGNKLLSSGKVKYIYFEYHKVYTLICKTNCSSIVSYLERFGYNCYLIGKYKIIRITSECYIEIDSQKLAHVLGIKDSIEKENSFINTYNNYYNINS